MGSKKSKKSKKKKSKKEKSKKKKSKKKSKKSKKCLDKKKTSVERDGNKYKIELEEEDAKCTDKDDRTYQYGQFEDVKTFSECAEKCVEDVKKKCWTPSAASISSVMTRNATVSTMRMRSMTVAVRAATSTTRRAATRMGTGRLRTRRRMMELFAVSSKAPIQSTSRRTRLPNT